VPLDNKRRLLAECGREAALLLADGCDRVIVAWDLVPAPFDDAKKGKRRPCRHDERAAVMASLAAAGVPLAKVDLLCIEDALERLLLKDDAAIRATIAEVTKRETQPLAGKRSRDSKKAMDHHFKDHDAAYDDWVHAPRIAERVALTRVRKVAAFKRLEKKLGRAR
jgi:hypothetical protein